MASSASSVFLVQQKIREPDEPEKHLGPWEPPEEITSIIEEMRKRSIGFILPSNKDWRIERGYIAYLIDPDKGGEATTSEAISIHETAISIHEQITQKDWEKVHYFFKKVLQERTTRNPNSHIPSREEVWINYDTKRNILRIEAGFKDGKGKYTNLNYLTDLAKVDPNVKTENHSSK